MPSVIRQMGNHPGGGHLRLPIALALAVLGCALPTAVGAAWQTLLSETGRRIEVDRSTIVSDDKGNGANTTSATVTSRIILDRAIVDPKSSSPYRVIEVVSRYDCNARTHSTVKRTYFKEGGDPLRAEEVKMPFDMPVRTGSPEDRILREVCRPKPATPSAEQAGNLASKASDAAVALRRENEALVARQVQKELAAAPAKFNVRATPVDDTLPAVAKRGEAVPRSPLPHSPALPADKADGRGRARVDNASCTSGRQQSPIDIRDTIAVDLEPIQFAYRPVPFRVADSRGGLQMSVYGGGFGLLGKTYALMRVDFRRPSETSVAGKVFEMEAQLVHRSEDGKLAVIVVLLESGAENPVIQTALNNLPLERGGELAPPGQTVDVERLLPDDRRYYAFMGSLTTPPCTEDVLWLVLKKPQPVSAEQQAIFARLYAPNARPVQAASGRIIKESR